MIRNMFRVVSYISRHYYFLYNRLRLKIYKVSLQENIKVKNELNEYRKDKILEEVCEDLADTQSEKMKTLAEGVSYEDDSENFEEKVKTIKENYFPNQQKQDENVEQVDASEGEEVSDPKLNNIMEAYSKAIARN